jgi:hypothetical protein
MKYSDELIRITLNHAAVDLSVSETLRLLDTYQKFANPDVPDQRAEELRVYGSAAGAELSVDDNAVLEKKKTRLLRGFWAHTRTRLRLMIATRWQNL